MGLFADPDALGVLGGCPASRELSPVPGAEPPGPPSLPWLVPPPHLQPRGVLKLGFVAWDGGHGARCGVSYTANTLRPFQPSR